MYNYKFVMNFIADCFSNIKFLFTCLMLLPLFSFANSQQEGKMLNTIESPYFKTVHAADKAVFPKTKKVFIAEISTAFAADWLSDFKSQTTDSYRNNILKDYKSMLENHLKEQFALAGWQVIDNNEKNALEVKAILKDIYINGPAKKAREEVLVKEIGRSTIEISVKGVDNEIIWLIEDTRGTGGAGGLFIETDKTTNFSWFSRLTKNWATIFVTYLDMAQPVQK